MRTGATLRHGFCCFTRGGGIEGETSLQPQVWVEFGAYIHQDFLNQYPNLTEGVLDFCQGRSAAKIGELHAFLHTVLADNYTNQELARLWAASGAQILVDDKSARSVFEIVQSAVEQCDIARKV